MREGEIKRRPLGITILAGLQLILSLFGILISLGLFMVAILTGQEAIRKAIGPNVPQVVLENGPAIFGSLGTVFLILSFIGLLLTWGFFKGKAWARVTALAVSVLYVLFAFLSPLLYGSVTEAVILDFVLATIVPMFIIYYLNRDDVRSFFGPKSTPMEWATVRQSK